MPSYRDPIPPGFEITKDLKTWETVHKCPRCFCEIYAGEKEGFRIEACGRCGGVWITDEESKRALAAGSRAPEDLANKVEAVTRDVIKDEVKPLACPECSEGMVKSTLGATQIDTCANHGTWFDRHEMRAVMRTLRGETKHEKTAEELEIEKMKSPLGTELADLKKLLSSFLDALIKATNADIPRRLE